MSLLDEVLPRCHPGRQATTAKVHSCSTCQGALPSYQEKQQPSYSRREPSGGLVPVGRHPLSTRCEACQKVVWSSPKP